MTARVFAGITGSVASGCRQLALMDSIDKFNQEAISLLTRRRHGGLRHFPGVPHTREKYGRPNGGSGHCWPDGWSRRGPAS
ncbi:MAG: hypothetical protein Ct9H300mP1_30960 [Planctomycetaceae bacterium]|nr:MAG: hypothetical protein Ct9H300mP1_30960 [Planctomycetaceae bacterium]